MKQYILYTLTGLLLFSSCDYILDQELVGQRTDQDFWTSETDIRDALAAAYGEFDTRALGLHDLLFDNQGDDHWRAGDHDEDEEIETFNTDPTNYKLADTYQYKYEVISSANGIIINAPDVLAAGEIEEATYNSYLGQAYFLRAYAYYRLYVIFGQVPILTEENVLSNDYNVAKCESTDALAEFILSDLETAASLLPLTNGTGEVTRGAAWALTTAVNMHMAEEYGDSEHLNAAITAGEQVISNYALHDTYLELFREGNEEIAENLFLMINDMTWINQELLSKHRGPRAWGMYGFTEPLDDLANEFETGDARKTATIVSDGEYVLQYDTYVEHTSELSNTGHSYFKYMDWEDAETFNYGLNIPFIRAAQTYLYVAEAKIRLNGAGAGDTEINLVRSRTGLADVSGADINDLIHETRVELAGENCRYDNLLRWHKAGVYDLATFFDDADKMYSADVGIRVWTSPKNYYQPLPQEEIDNSDGVLVQNPYWAE